jgi:hypothetical protein
MMEKDKKDISEGKTKFSIKFESKCVEDSKNKQWLESPDRFILYSLWKEKS